MRCIGLGAGVGFMGGRFDGLEVWLDTPGQGAFGLAWLGLACTKSGSHQTRDGLGLFLLIFLWAKGIGC